MATLENIRKRGPLVALVIGFALLAFILGDFLNSGTTLFTGNQFEILNVNGNSVNYQEYQAKVEESETVYKLSSGQALAEGVGEQIRAQVWEGLIQENLLENEYNEIGIGVHPDEVFELVNTGRGLSPGLRQAFTNPNTGVYDQNAVMNFLKNIDQDPNAKAIWMYHENDMIRSRKLQKYINLVAKGLYVTKAQAQQELQDRSKMVDIEFVAQSYASIPDSAVTVTDSDLEKYYNEHQYLFEQEQSRDVAYVTFDVRPSPRDIAESEAHINEIAAEFQRIEIEKIEKYVNANSDRRFDPTNYKKGELPNYELDSIMFTAEPGTMYGPYRDEQKFKLARLVKRSMVADSVKARHILIGTQTRSLADAKALADSLKGQIEKGIAFEAIAKEYSDDKSNADKGGDLDWFTEGAMVKEFNDACFNNNPGDIVTAETQFGVHIIRIDDKTKPVEKVQVAQIEYQILPSETTRDSIYTLASQFALDYNTADKFDEGLAKEGKIKKMASNLLPGQNQIPGLENPRELIKWAYNDAQNNDVSPVFELGDRFVVGVLTAVREKGIAKFSQVKPEVTIAVKKQKKAAMLKQKMNANKDLASLAANLGIEVLSAQNISFSSFQIAGAGTEPQLIGTALKMNKGDISAPIEGNNGVYVVKVTELTNPEMENPDLTIDKQRVEQNLQSRAGYELYNALKKSANIEDGRAKFF